MTASSTPPIAPPIDTETGNYFVSNYPPFSQWNEAHIPDFMQALGQPAHQQPLGLYVHIPFCRQRCAYCYFRVHVKEAAESIDRYLDAVLSEAAHYASFPAISGRPLQHVYFGGGTPTWLTVAQIQHLIGGLKSRLPWTNHVDEVTYECQPGTLTAEKLAALVELGVNRASIGVQTLTDEVLRQLGRLANAREATEAVGLARGAGFRQINLDFIAGLPGETEASWQATIDRAVELAPDSLTIYQFELTHNSVLNRLQGRRRLTPLPSWPEKRRWVAWAFDRLRAAGYTPISAYWAVRNPQQQRFAYVTESFWKGADLLALGETSFGHLAGIHYQNRDDLGPYLAAVEQGTLPLWRAYRMNPEERLRREVILQLKTGSLALAYFAGKFGIDLRHHFAKPLGELAQRGLLTIGDGEIRLTEEGLLSADWILPMFYLPHHRGVRYT